MVKGVHSLSPEKELYNLDQQMDSLMGDVVVCKLYLVKSSSLWWILWVLEVAMETVFASWLCFAAATGCWGVSGWLIWDWSSFEEYDAGCAMVDVDFWSPEMEAKGYKPYYYIVTTILPQCYHIITTMLPQYYHIVSDLLYWYVYL